MGWKLRTIYSAIAVLAVLPVSVPAQESGLGKYSDFTPYQERWLTTEPRDPSREWLTAYGGRLYDNWMKLLNREVPGIRHPSYPASGKEVGPNTWRCKECHGWDYNGSAGAYGNKESSHYTGIKGIRAFAGGDPLEVVEILRDERHGYDQRMLPKWAAERIALFVTEGQIETERYLDDSGAPLGDAERGRGVYQNLCAVCHGFDGRSLNFGSQAHPEYLGTVAAKNAPEVLHKARNGHPGAIMPAQIWVDIQTLVDVASYARTLPRE